MFIKVTNDTSDNVARIMAKQVTTWEYMDSNRMRVFTTDGHQMDIKCDIDNFDDAIHRALNGEVVDITY